MSCKLITKRNNLQEPTFRSKSYSQFQNEFEKPINPVHVWPKIDRYSITRVIKKGYFNLIRYLLALGFDPNYVCPKEPFQRTSLIYCTYIRDDNWCLNVARNLLEHGASLVQTDSRNLNPIHYCCAFGREDLLGIFLNAVDFDLTKAVDSNGNTCFHYAILNGNLNCIQMLIKTCKKYRFKRVDVKNVYGLKPSEIDDQKLESLDGSYKPRRAAIKQFVSSDINNECKSALLDYLKYVADQKEKEKERELKKAMALLSNEDQNDKRKKKKTKNAAKTKKKSKVVNKTISKESSLENLNEKDEDQTENKFFETELTDDYTLIKSTELLKRPPNQRSCKSSPVVRLQKSVVSQQNKNVSVEIEKSKTNLNENQSLKQKVSVFQGKQFIEPHVAYVGRTESLPSKPKSAPVQCNIGKKQFLLSLNELLANYIDYNNLFYAKEYIIHNSLASYNSNIEFDFMRDSFKNKRNHYFVTEFYKGLHTNYEMKVKNRSASALDSVSNKNWKDQVPQSFKALEHTLTNSYRNTIHPHVSKKVKKQFKMPSHFRSSSSNITTKTVEPKKHYVQGTYSQQDNAGLNTRSSSVIVNETHTNSSAFIAGSNLDSSAS